jgi:hypothetical protein
MSSLALPFLVLIFAGCAAAPALSPGAALSLLAEPRAAAAVRS